jgi:hypothetical protein
VLKALAEFPVPQVELQKASKKEVLDYIEVLVRGGMTKRILRPLAEDWPQTPGESSITLRLVDTTCLAALCQLSEAAELKCGFTADGTLVVIDADDSAPSTEIYYVFARSDEGQAGQYEVQLPSRRSTR